MMKLTEFGDTVFIVKRNETLRKQPLIFLHWYHHITVFLYTWLSFVETIGCGSWFSKRFYTFLHVFLLCFESKRFSLPKWISIMLTTLQIVQMFWGIIIIFSAYYYVHVTQIQCNVTISNYLR